MAQPYVGEIRLFGGNFAPAGWMFCDGQLLAISENDTLFSLIGTTYGGDGQSTFALPDLRGRVPIHQGAGPGNSNRTVGESGGVEAVVLTPTQLPAHRHVLLATSRLADTAAVGGRITARSTTVDIYINESPAVALAPQAATLAGGSQPHENMMPTLGISFIISLFGIYPSPT